MRPAASVILVMCVFGSAHAEPDSLDDLLGPREIAVGEALRGAATGQSAVALNPAGLALNRELVFEGGYGYRASDNASLVGVSACDSTTPVPGCFFYDYATSSPDLGGDNMSRTTHLAGVSLSRLLVPRVLVGTTTKYYRFDSNVMSESSARGFGVDLGATVRVSEMINVGVAAHNLWTTTDSSHFPRAIGAGLMARPMPILSVSFDSRWKLIDGDHSARFGGGGELFLRGSNGAMGYPLRVGAVHDNGLGSTFITGGLGIVGMRWGVDVGARREVRGGDETLILASMRFFGPRLAAPGVDGVSSGME
ncbi:MAG: hypothetical protein AB7P03_27810 [Kofleriaceae bacterium]